MSTVNEVVTTTIEIKDAAVSQEGFGVPLIAAAHTFWAETVRRFEDADELLKTPFSVPDDHFIYLAAAALKRQRPAVTEFLVGKRGVALAIGVDLAAIRAANDDWYALLIDSNAEADIVAAAAWAEGQRVLFFATTADADVKASTGDGGVGAGLVTGGYNRTVLMYHHDAAQQAAAAWAGRMLPKAPGSATWANKSLAGVDTSTLSADERATLTGRNVNYYVPIKKVGFTLHGVASSGRFIDITQGMDWFEVRTQERFVGLFANSDKVPYTDKGGELLRAQVVAQILEGIEADLIDGAAPWSVTVPTVASINPATKIARRFPDVKFRFVLSGAVHKVEVVGTVLISL
jgi:hypothetical protein